MLFLPYGHRQFYFGHYFMQFCEFLSAIITVNSNSVAFVTKECIIHLQEIFQISWVSFQACLNGLLFKSAAWKHRWISLITLVGSRMYGRYHGEQLTLCRIHVSILWVGGQLPHQVHKSFLPLHCACAVKWKFICWSTIVKCISVEACKDSVWTYFQPNTSGHRDSHMTFLGRTDMRDSYYDSKMHVISTFGAE